MNTSSDEIIARYRIARPATDDKHWAESGARAIALEQTVEVPAALAESVAHMVGTVQHIEQDADAALVDIAYPAHLASEQVGQLFNLAYGNVSLYDRVRLVDLRIPDGLADTIGGPRFGLAGVRARCGVYDRPLLATVIKPRGASAERFRSIAEGFARAGGDILKDDQNLVHRSLDDFRHHVENCAMGVTAGNAAGGHHCLYFPHLAGSPERLSAQAEFIAGLGLPGFLICPMVTGLEAAKAIAADHDLIMMAHPALAGAYTEPEQHGIALPVLQGTLYRLAGADISIFPGPGGRISNADERCHRTIAALTEPLGSLAPSLPCPAGGKRLEEIPHLAAAYGEDAMLLFGGDLLGYDEDPQRATAVFLQALNRHFDERRTTPPSLAESNLPDVADSYHLTYLEGFRWHSRETESYKPDQHLPHNGVSRTTLVGSEASTGFELRYFEIAAGGFTSLEQHRHTHVLIGATGVGTLQVGSRTTQLRPHDVSYVGPDTPHQLRNEGQQAFGFYCLVDRHRDRPRAVDS